MLFLVFVVQSLSGVWLFVTPRTAACQASLSFTVSQSLLKFMSIESMMLSNHLILCCPLLLLPSIFPSIRVFSNESLEGLMLNLKLQYFGQLMANSWLIGKDPHGGKDWRQKEKRATEDEMVGWHHWCNRMNLCKLWEMVRDRDAWSAVVHGVTKSLTWLGDWTTITLP